jgi:chromosome segregation ATPase
MVDLASYFDTCCMCSPPTLVERTVRIRVPAGGEELSSLQRRQNASPTAMNEEGIRTLASPNSGPNTGAMQTEAIEKQNKEQAKYEFDKSKMMRNTLKIALEDVKLQQALQEADFNEQKSKLQNLKAEGQGGDKVSSDIQTKIVSLGKAMAKTRKEVDVIKTQMESANQQIAKYRRQVLNNEIARFITKSSPSTPSSNNSPPAAHVFKRTPSSPTKFPLSSKAVGN